MSEDRRENNDFIYEAIKRIDSRTEDMDQRLRNVETKIYNGMSTHIKTTADKVDAIDTRLKDAEKLLQHTPTNNELEERAKERRNATIKYVATTLSLPAALFAIYRILSEIGVL